MNHQIKNSKSEKLFDEFRNEISQDMQYKSQLKPVTNLNSPRITDQKQLVAKDIAYSTGVTGLTKDQSAKHQTSFQVEDQNLNLEEVDHNNESDFKKYQTIFQIAVPTILCMLVVNAQQIVNLVFAGHLGNSSMIAAIGLGNLIQNIFIECIIWGLNGSVENMVS